MGELLSSEVLSAALVGASFSDEAGTSSMVSGENEGDAPSAEEPRAGVLIMLWGGVLRSWRIAEGDRACGEGESRREGAGQRDTSEGAPRARPHGVSFSRHLLAILLEVLQREQPLLTKSHREYTRFPRNAQPLTVNRPVLRRAIRPLGQSPNERGRALVRIAGAEARVARGKLLLHRCASCRVA